MGLALAAGACHTRASPEDCRGMADHYVELAARETPGAATMSPAQVAAVRNIERGLKRAEAAYRRVQDHCEDVTRAEFGCAMGAVSTQSWEACVRPFDAGR
jgi:hypothetical protein